MVTTTFSGSITDVHRALVVNSLTDFLVARRKQKSEMIKHVETMLAKHKIAESAIGLGLADDFVKAGKSFLRIVSLYKLNN